MPEEYESTFGLVDIISIDGSLSGSDRVLFISLAKLFEKDFRANINRTSLELNEIYKTSDPALWQKFLSHASVNNYIESYVLEEIEKKAYKALQEVTDPAKALKAKEAIDKKRNRTDNSNIILMLLPHKDDEDIGL